MVALNNSSHLPTIITDLKEMRMSVESHVNLYLTIINLQNTRVGKSVWSSNCFKKSQVLKKYLRGQETDLRASTPVSKGKLLCLLVLSVL